jgi:hypothetical protein
MKNETYCSQMVHTFKRCGIYEQEGLEQEDFQTVLRAAGETETTQENVRDWLQLEERDPGIL